MRVLVTGAGGFLGRAVVSMLAERGHDVVSLVRTARSSDLGSHLIGDVRDADAMRRSVAGVDAVCHLAALARVRESFTAPLDYWQTNAAGTLSLLSSLVAEAGHSGPKRLVIASTAAVYGTHMDQPVTEDAPTVPGSPYGASKLAADQAAADVAATGLIGAVSLRAFNIAGASGGVVDRDRTRLIPKALAVLAGLEPELLVNGDGSAIRDFVHVVDMAEAFALALDACTPGTWRAYNVGSGRRVRIADVLNAAAEETGRRLATRYGPAANEPPILLADSTRIRRDLGWQPIRSDISRIIRDAWNALTSGYAVSE